MGREVRNVIPNWEHPKTEVWDYQRRAAVERYQPLHDRDVETAFREWLAEWQEWVESKFASTISKYPEDDYDAHSPYREFCEWSGRAPDPAYYRPNWKEGEATWFQLYETVSEGTPVSPPFETREELAQYLATNGDFWYQGDVADGRETFRTKPTLEQARSLVNSGWAMSGIMVQTAEGGKVLDAYEQQDLKQSRPEPDGETDQPNQHVNNTDRK
jgi:hypothetical protein